MTGYQYILNGLRKRFGQEDIETTVMTLVELITFRRQGGESIDDCCARYEALRNRISGLDQAIQIPYPVTAFLFLEAIQVPRAVWPIVLQASNGTLPLTQDAFDNMMAMLRRQGHLAEHTHAGPTTITEGIRGNGKGYGHGNNYFGDSQSAGNCWADTAGYVGGQSYYGGLGESNAQSSSGVDGHYVVYDEDGYPCCSACASYLYGEDDGYDDSETDDDDLDTSHFTQEELQEYYGDLSTMNDYETLKHEYLFAKRRFRRFADRYSRRSRFPRTNWSLRMPAHQKGRNYFGKGSVVNPGSLAGGKGQRQAQRKALPRRQPWSHEPGGQGWQHHAMLRLRL